MTPVTVSGADLEARLIEIERHEREVRNAYRKRQRERDAVRLCKVPGCRARGVGDRLDRGSGLCEYHSARARSGLLPKRLRSQE